MNPGLKQVENHNNITKNIKAALLLPLKLNGPGSILI